MAYVVQGSPSAEAGPSAFCLGPLCSGGSSNDARRRNARHRNGRRSGEEATQRSASAPSSEAPLPRRGAVSRETTAKQRARRFTRRAQRKDAPLQGSGTRGSGERRRGAALHHRKRGGGVAVRAVRRYSAVRMYPDRTAAGRGPPAPAVASYNAVHRKARSPCGRCCEERRGMVVL